MSFWNTSLRKLSASDFPNSPLIKYRFHFTHYGGKGLESYRQASDLDRKAVHIVVNYTSHDLGYTFLTLSPSKTKNSDIHIIKNLWEIIDNNIS